MNGKEWYNELLKRPEWLTKRREVYKRDSRTCVDCGAKGVTIHCHHEYYVSNKKPWEYPLHALVTVCGKCHDKRHTVLITKHKNHEEAEIWLVLTAAEADLLKQETEEELEKRRERIDELDRKGAEWHNENQYYGLVDEEGRSRFYDADGNPL